MGCIVSTEDVGADKKRSTKASKSSRTTRKASTQFTLSSELATPSNQANGRSKKKPIRNTTSSASKNKCSQEDRHRSLSSSNNAPTSSTSQEVPNSVEGHDSSKQSDVGKHQHASHQHPAIHGKTGTQKKAHFMFSSSDVAPSPPATHHQSPVAHSLELDNNLNDDLSRILERSSARTGNTPQASSIPFTSPVSSILRHTVTAGTRPRNSSFSRDCGAVESANFHDGALVAFNPLDTANSSSSSRDDSTPARRGTRLPSTSLAASGTAGPSGGPSPSQSRPPPPNSVDKESFVSSSASHDNRDGMLSSLHRPSLESGAMPPELSMTMVHNGLAQHTAPSK